MINKYNVINDHKIDHQPILLYITCILNNISDWILN